MTTMTMRLSESDAQLVRQYCKFEGKTISQFIRDAVFERIQDAQDVEQLRAAIAADSGQRYTHADILHELGL